MSEEEHDTTEHDTDVADIEAEARQYGWSGKDRWRGKPEDFVEAGEFVRRAKEHLPVVNSLLSKERARTTDLERQTREVAARAADLEKRLAAQAKMHDRLMDQQRATLIEQFDAEKRAALAIDDPTKRQAAYDRAQRRELDAVKAFNDVEREEAPKPAAKAPPVQEIAPDVQERGAAWLAKNEWLSDPIVRSTAGMIPIPANRPDLDFRTDPEAHFEYIKGEMEKRFPGLTTGGKERTPPPPKHAAVESSSGRSAGRGAPKVKGFGELPPEAKAACERMISSRLVKGDETKLAEFRKSYATNYWKDYGND
jgi:hypothetical protein